MTTREQILAANEATFRAWNAHDPDAIAAIFAEDAESVDVAAHDTIRGRAGIRERAADLIDAASAARGPRHPLHRHPRAAAPTRRRMKSAGSVASPRV